MLSGERRNIIRNTLLEKKNITVSDMVDIFGVSSETIRRDLEFLEEEGFLIKTYGGASLKDRVSSNVPKRILSGILVENKRRMAVAAAKRIRPNECIFLDHSTTVYEMCPLIEKIPLTIMTNSLNVMSYFAESENIHLVALGGNFNATAYAFFGLETIRFLQKHMVDKAFLSCRGVSLNRGLSEGSDIIAEMRKSIISNSVQSFLLADHTKIGKNAFISSCPLSAVSCLITDEKLNCEWSDGLNEMHIKYIECTE